MRRNNLIAALLDFGEDKDKLMDMTTDELQELYDEISDTSNMHPNETEEEFFDHEDY